MKLKEIISLNEGKMFEFQNKINVRFTGYNGKSAIARKHDVFIRTKERKGL